MARRRSRGAGPYCFFETGIRRRVCHAGTIAHWHAAISRSCVHPRNSVSDARVIPGGLRRVEKGGKQSPRTEAGASAGLFTVPQDQLAHLKIAPVAKTSWGVAIHTTGTVDWDPDHTTQAITQVNGPISRILVDIGHAGDRRTIRCCTSRARMSPTPSRPIARPATASDSTSASWTA